MAKTPQSTTVSLGGHTNEERVKIEAERGIVRDAEGRIIRSKKWKKDRVKFLKDRLEDIDNRRNNILAEIDKHESDLA